MMLTPMSLWKDFDADQEIQPVFLGEKEEDGIKYEYYNLYGRDTGAGRVRIYGVFATSSLNPSSSGVLIIPDSADTVDEQLLKMFVDGGYSAFMVDIRGRWEGIDNYTIYPDNIKYANLASCGRRKDYVDDNADKTSWYEWVAVGVYARKFLINKLNTPEVGVVGIRDGGEVVWKLAYVAHFSCAVTVCAGGWKAYSKYSKFGGEEPLLDDERYRFLAGIDSQAYAPYVQCPMLMLCSTNDPKFDYDRAYDTFSRINPKYADGSVISYAVKSNACIGSKSIKDMFMFLDRYVKHRHVFIPRVADVSIQVDEEDNLIARTTFDDSGKVASFGFFIAEDCKNSTIRDWAEAPYKRKISDVEHEFYLNVYEKTSILFALCYVEYSNGFSVWSRMTVKKISGRFRNSQPKSNVMYSSKNGCDCFAIADYKCHAIGGTFLTTDDYLPAVVNKGKGLKGIYSVCGLATYRLNTPQYAPSSDSILKLDVYPDENMTLILCMENVSGGEIYTAKQYVVGGVWQSLLIESKNFKNTNGSPLSDYTQGLKFMISGDKEYAVNNVMWL